MSELLGGFQHIWPHLQMLALAVGAAMALIALAATMYTMKVAFGPLVPRRPVDVRLQAGRAPERHRRRDWLRLTNAGLGGTRWTGVLVYFSLSEKE